MRDLIAEEILNNRLRNEVVHERQLNFPAARNPRPRPTPARIPPANRYPHSIVRDDLERARSPWNRAML